MKHPVDGTRRRWRELGGAAAALPLLLATSPALAEGRLFLGEPFQGKKMAVDGLLREWPGSMVSLGDLLQGSEESGDPQVAAQLGYDDKYVYVALKIADDAQVRTPEFGAAEDRATLSLAFPRADKGFNRYDLELFHGVPGKSAGAVLMKGAKVAGARLVEAPDKAGFTVEAAVPWSTFPDATRVRVGLRAVVRYHDHDPGKGRKAEVATSRASAPGEFPGFLLEGEQGLFDSVIRAHGLAEEPSQEAVGNVAGSALFERVARYGDYLTIVGPAFRGGKEFYFSEHGRGLVDLDLVDFDGDGRAEIVLRTKLGEEASSVEVLGVISIGSDDVPTMIFEQEVAVTTAEGSFRNKVSYVKAPRGGSKLVLEQGEASGIEQASYHKLTPDSVRPALLPWQPVKSREFTFDGKAFTAGGEKAFKPRYRSGEKKPPAAARPEPAEAGPPAPPPPRPPSADELLDQVYALYRKERGVGNAKPRFDFVTDVVGDGTMERVLVHGKDVVTFGKGFLAGTRYTYITLPLADPKDIVDVSARDLTGDGKAEILVRGVFHTKTSKDAGGEIVDRQMFFVYQASEQGLKRVFGVETGRALGDRRILAGLAFLPARQGVVLEVRAGRALGWTEKTYPWPEETGPVGGLEPLVLPWSERKRRAYAFEGGAFVAR